MKNHHANSNTTTTTSDRIALRRTVRTAALASAVLLTPPAVAQSFTYRLVAQTGDAAPGSLNGTFTGLGHPQINASGQVAFVASTTGAIADTGMWKSKFDNPQQLALVIGEDYPLPNSPASYHFGTFDSSLHHPLLLDDGSIGFSAPFVSPAISGTGLFRMVNGAIQKVLLSGDAAPGLPAGVFIDSIANLPSMSPAGSMTIDASLIGTGVNDANNRILYRAKSNATIAKVVRRGDAAPGIPGTIIKLWSSQFASIGDDDVVGYNGSLEGAVTESWSRWLGDPGSTDAIVVHGDSAPLGGSFAGGFDDFWTLTLSAGALTISELVDTGAGLPRTICRFDEQGATELARVGKAAPLGSYTEIADALPEVDHDGTTVFTAKVAGGGVSALTDSIVVRAKKGVPSTVVVREGDPAPGYAAGVQFEDFLSILGNTALMMSNSDHVLVQAKVRGPGINADNDQGVWLVHDGFAPELVIREGQFLFIGGAFHQVDGFVVSRGNGMHSGRRPGVNGRGAVAMLLYFTNGDSAIVVAQPHPACPGDLNDDGVVDAVDLGILLGSWGTPGPVGTGGDVDLDGDTDGADLGAMLGAWGVCGA